MSHLIAQLAAWLQQTDVGPGEEVLEETSEWLRAAPLASPLWTDSSGDGKSLADRVFDFLGVTEADRGLDVYHITVMYLYRLVLMETIIRSRLPLFRRVEMVKKAEALRDVCVAHSGSLGKAFEIMGSEESVDIHEWE